ncbi:uncharacterized protein TNCT_387661 [Trichonephila clavata]|uniref:Uncharacterized protein n=1 Tax=Trichonephila clavata TaxID=2740835 RepID=A0A8X6JC66_TRICU|nr:uncharacterized protein TNCT_387661 [Trichonephila clavata]
MFKLRKKFRGINKKKTTDSELSGDFVWNENPFAGQEHTLKWFSAVRCSLTGALTYDFLESVNIKCLENLQRLDGIDLSQNHLVTVQKSAFSHIPRNFKTITLSRKIIKEVLPGSFHGLKILQHIDLSHNVLENITRDIFNCEPKFLRRINLRKELKRAILMLYEGLTRWEYIREDQWLKSHSFQLLERPFKTGAVLMFNETKKTDQEYCLLISPEKIGAVYSFLVWGGIMTNR